MIQVAVHGAQGRMGKLITELVSAAEDCQLCGLITEPGLHQAPGHFHPELPLLGQDLMKDELPRGCIIIDFSLAPALDGLLEQARALQAPLVVGTTGFTNDQQAALQQYSREFPVVQAANFSIGIPALQMMLQLLAKTLPAGFDAEQVETHHHTKIDKPSGTARHLAAHYQKLRPGTEPVVTHSQRLGGIIGEHSWTFSDKEETLVLTHRAHSRQAFLRGILPSVRFLKNQENGMFGLTHVLQSLGGSA